MSKKQQKWISLLVVCTFVSLMQVSTMPVVAAGTTEQVSSADAEPGPDYLEAVGRKAVPAKKKSILPYALIGVGVLAVTAAVLFLFVLNKYDITGKWQYSWKNTGDANWVGASQELIFNGDKKSGLLIYHGNEPGTYSVSGKDVTFKFQYDPDFSVTHTGKFVTKDKISGSWICDQYPSTNGTWEAARVATTAQAALPQTSAGMPGKDKSE